LAAGVPAKPLKPINDGLKQRILEGAIHYQKNGKRFRDAGIVAEE
jgi:hypothetical protein